MKHVKTIIVSVMCMVVCFMSISCKKEIPQISESEMRNICELAVLECYYHGNAKLNKPGTLFKKEKTVWIDYTAKIKVGFDINQMVFNMENTNVTITLPDPKLLQEPEIISESMNYFSSENSILPNVKMVPEEPLEAIAKTNAHMTETLNSNSSVMRNAENRVKTILKNYIDQIGKMSGTEYTITWEHTKSNFAQLN